MDFRILGPVEVHDEGGERALAGPGQRALLALLLLHANEVVSTETLVDELWEEAPASGATAVQNAVSRLRKVLGPGRVVTRGRGYRLRVDPGEADLDRFASAVRRAERTADPRERALLLRAALAEWRGTALAGVGSVPFVAAERGRLEELRLAALEDRIDAELAAGGHADVVAELAALVAEHPLRERARGQLMLALYGAGRQAEALDVYRETRRLLADELGLEPGPALQELQRAILRHDPGLAPADPRTAPAAEPRRPATRALVLAAAAAAGAAVAGGAAFVAVRGGPESTAGAAGTAVPARLGRAPEGAAAALPARGSRAAGEPAPAAGERRARPTAPRAPSPTRVEAPPARPRAPTGPRASSSPRRPRAPAPPRAVPAAERPAATAPEPSPPATAPAPAAPRPAPPRPGAVEDDFERGPGPDPAIWHVVESGAGARWGVRGGRAVFSLDAAATPSGAWNAVAVHFGTHCRFPGDFDARVEYEVLRWPAASGANLFLAAFFADAKVQRISRPWGDEHASWLPPRFSTSAVDAAARTGALRLARVGGIVTASARVDGVWAEIASGPAAGTAVIGIGLDALAHDWAAKHVEVAFDAFAVTARESSCPPGSR